MNRLNKIIVIAFCCFTICCAKVSAQGKKYYVAVSGNDSNNGLSRQTAWHLPDKINTTDLKPGDSVLFEPTFCN